MRLQLHGIVAALALASAGAAFAGTVNVSFVNPARFSDAGSTTSEERNNLAALARHLEGLGQRTLPPNQVLRVQVLDVDLAGTLRDTPGGVRLRVVRGGADWPRIDVRYTLEADGRPVRGAEERVSDLTYTSASAFTSHPSEALYYEKRMLEQWLRTRFSPEAQASSR